MMYKIILYNKWATKDKWKHVKTSLYQTDEQYKKFFNLKKTWCKNICKPLDGQSINLNAKLVCKKLIEEEWQTIEEVIYE